MKRLFIACELPSQAMTDLAALQPTPADGVRLTRSDQIHLTLHFLGDADPERIALALQDVSTERFELTLAGVGRFPTRDGLAILWAGVEVNEQLLALHSQIGTILERQGIATERRPYKPHLTLARCRWPQAREAIDDFLERHANFRLPKLLIDSFTLFSSQLTHGGPIYTCERKYPLK